MRTATERPGSAVTPTPPHRPRTPTPRQAWLAVLTATTAPATRRGYTAREHEDALDRLLADLARPDAEVAVKPLAPGVIARIAPA